MVSQELFELSPGPLESRRKEVDSTASRPTLKVFPIKAEERAANTEWLTFPVSLPKRINETAPSASPIQPGQRPIETPSPTVTTPSWKVNQKTPEYYERERVCKYAPYFQSNVILPIPEVANVLEPRIFSLVVFNIKNRRFAGLFWGAPSHSRHPRTIFLQKEFCNVGCAAAIEGTSGEAGRLVFLQSSSGYNWNT